MPARAAWAIAIQLAKHLGAYVATTTSTANIALVKSLGADVVVDYKNDDFEKVLQGYDVVLNSLGKDTLEKSLGVMKPGGKLISISGPPDPDFARENGSGWLLQQVMRLLSSGIRRKSKRRRISYSFLFMTANGGQLGKITSLIEAGDIRPVMDRVFPFERTNEALDYVETGRAKGKVVVAVKRRLARSFVRSLASALGQSGPGAFATCSLINGLIQLQCKEALQ
jgi:NADPH:quinone reductase-like Zn-dependent oxidoreductase